jgi:2,3-bisphosphoglycerate-independent phosphoglycerate mutase
VSAPHPGLLVVVDGWGHRAEAEGNAFRIASTPFLDELTARWPWTLLHAAGDAVGLPPGVVGNSEIGHLTIGAGRVVEYESTRVERAGQTGELASHPVLGAALERVRAGGHALHLLGLCSDGMVHGHVGHFAILLVVARQAGVERVLLHPFSDGRDVPDGTAGRYLAELEELAARAGVGRVATLIGRGYTMDRSGAWEKTAAAYRALVAGEGARVRRPQEAIEAAAAAGLADEHIPPTVVVGADGQPIGTVRDGDLVLFLNFRGDRMRQLVQSFAHDDFAGFERGDRARAEVLTLTEYFLHPPVIALFGQSDASGGLADLLEHGGVRNVRIAESEKFPHVTFFLNGRDGRTRELEEHVHVPSPKGVEYRLVPAMSAGEVTRQAVGAVARPDAGLVVVNLANADVVAHSGDAEAVGRAVEAVDAALRGVCEAAWSAGRWVAVVGDHGNAEVMLDPATGTPHVGHTTNPVPFVLAHSTAEARLRPDGSLADVAPTVAGLLGLARGRRMDGEGLIVDLD